MLIKDLKTYIITIKSPEEISKTIENVEKFGLENIQIFKGIVGKDISKDFIENNLTIRARYELKNGRFSTFALSGIGSLGCYLSHIALWNKIKDTNETIIILEDDFNTNKKIDILQNSFNDAIHNNYDILRFAYTNSVIADNPQMTKKINSNLTKYNFEFGFQGYIINSNGAKKLLKHIFPIDVQIDGFVNLYQNINPDFNMFYTKTNFNKQLYSFNSITHSNLKITNTFRLVFGILISVMIIISIYVCYRFYIKSLSCNVSKSYIY